MYRHVLAYAVLAFTVLSLIVLFLRTRYNSTEQVEQRKRREVYRKPRKPSGD